MTRHQSTVSCVALLLAVVATSYCLSPSGLVTSEDPSAEPVGLVRTANASNNRLLGEVVGITDGDSLTILIDRQPTKVRLVGIDAPERRQAFSAKARSRLADLCLRRTVVVESHGTDRYDRLLGDVYVDGQSVAHLLLAEGLAWHYVEYSDDSELALLELTARDNRQGIWSEAHPVAPWEYRRIQRLKKNSHPPQLLPVEGNADGLPHWLNTSSNVRHNTWCRWYGHTKGGRYCQPNEGTPCGECGG